MKILVLHHTAWIEMLIHSWQMIGDVEILALQIPVTQMDTRPELRVRVAKTIADGIAKHRVDLVLDVNGAGVLPLDSALQRWTTTESAAPWCEWWWDDPINYAGRKSALNELDEWTDALTRHGIRHFIWDATLAREYSVWFNSTWTYLPTATNTGFFHPDAAGLSARKFTPCDIAFLGTYYPRQASPNEQDRTEEVDFLAERRVANPDETIFDLLDKPKERNGAKGILDDITTARTSKNSAFSPLSLKWKNRINREVGHRRRTATIESLSPAFPRRLFVGDHWPSDMRAETGKTFQPTELAAIYQTAAFSLELGNGQAYSGTALRSYEIMACGGVLTTNQRPDFDPDGSLRDSVYITFSSASELAILKEHYANNQRSLAEIRSNARDYAAAKHSWACRLPRILEKL